MPAVSNDPIKPADGVFSRMGSAPRKKWARLALTLKDGDPAAALDTADVIFDAIDILAHSPEIGRKVHAGNRELVISRGRTGYLALYRYLPSVQRVLVLALRHQREAGYKSL